MLLLAGTRPHNPNSWETLALGMAVVAATAHAPRVVDGEDAVVEEVGRMVTITALHRDLATIVIPTDTHPPGAMAAAVAAGQQICPSMVARR